MRHSPLNSISIVSEVGIAGAAPTMGSGSDVIVTGVSTEVEVGPQDCVVARLRPRDCDRRWHARETDGVCASCTRCQRFGGHAR